MKIILDKMDSRIYVMNPQIEKIQGQNRMTLLHSGCTHVLLLRTSLDEEIDIDSETLQKSLTGVENNVLSGSEITLSDGKTAVWAVDFITLQRNRNSIRLPEKAGNYAVCGCRYDNQSDVLTIYLPDKKSFRYQARVSIEVRYHIEPYRIIVKTGIFGRKEERTDFYRVVIGDVHSSYLLENIVYAVEGIPFQFPLTEEMKGKEFLIKTMKGKEPVFRALSAGLELKKV